MRRTRSTSGTAQRIYAALLRPAPRFDPGGRFCRLIEPAYIYRQPQRHLRSLLLGLCDAPRATRCGYARPALYMNKRDTHSICIATSRVTRHCRWSLIKWRTKSKRNPFVALLIKMGYLFQLRKGTQGQCMCVFL